jgi:tRNA (guanine37-N1)-methyltransferase
MIARARKEQLIDLHLIDLRTYGMGNYRQVDDRVYGGGPGMVLMAQPVSQALREAKAQTSGQRQRTLYMSPQGTPLTAAKCRELAQWDHLVVLCGHYEGVDQRVLDNEVDEEISIGDYVLTNGCLPAIVLVDAVSRFIPGVIGHSEAAAQDSFETGLLDCPHYTRPEVYEGVQVPQVLQDGNHADIARWRHQQALKKTHHVRPDLFVRYVANETEIPTDASAVVMLRQITLQVADLQRSRRFYRESMGLKPARFDDAMLRYRLGEVELLLVPLQGVENKKQAVVLECETEKWQQMAARVQKSGAGRVEAEKVWLTDPDGHLWVLAETKRQ